MSKKNEVEGYALVFWMREKLSDVIDLKCVPPSKRQPDSTTMLDWQSHITGKSTREKAKIIAVDAKKEVLEAMIIDDRGNIVDAATKIFSQTIMDEKKTMDSKKKHRTKKAALSKTDLSMKMNKQESLMNIALSKTPNGNKHKSSSPPLRRSPRISPRVTYTDDSSNAVNIQQSQTSKNTRVKDSSQVFDVSVPGESDSDERDGAGLIIGPTEDERGPASFCRFLEQVTPRDINSLRHLLAAMEDSLRRRTGKIVKPEHINVFEIPDRFTQPGKDKVEIAPGCGIYFPQYRIYNIENTYTNGITGFFDWEGALRDLLLEVYGENIVDFSAKGSRAGSRPGISQKVYDGFYCWLSRKENLLSELNDKTYYAVINNQAYNKRKHQNQKNSSKRERDPQSEKSKRSASTAFEDTSGSDGVVKSKEEESNFSPDSDMTTPSPSSNNLKKQRKVLLDKENISALGDADNAAGSAKIQVSYEPQFTSPSVLPTQSEDQQLRKQKDWSHPGNISHYNYEPTRQPQWYPDYSQTPVNSSTYGFSSVNQWPSTSAFNQHYGHQHYVNGPYPHQHQAQPFTPLQNMPTAYPQASTPSFPLDSSYGYAPVQSPACNQLSVPTTATIASDHQHLQPISHTPISSVSSAATEYSG